MIRMNSDKFQSFSFEPEIAIFDDKSQKWLLGQNLGFLRIHLIDNLRDFPE